jgi:hypothetical protein
MVASTLAGTRRSFLADSKALLSRLNPPLHIIGRVPDLAGSSWLVIVNHHYRPGFIAWWMPLSITAVLGREIHWIMTSAWRTVAGRNAAWLLRLSSILLRRAARIYGFTSMPAMPPLPGETQARALAVRKVLKHVDETPQAIVGLAPEGRDNPQGWLATPPPGVGRFVCQLAKRGLRLLPTGLFEMDGKLCLQIGTPMKLPQIEGASAQRDQKMSDLLMAAISRCLPEHMRGPYS